MTQFSFNRAEGIVFHDSTPICTIAYSGNGDGLNNPAMQEVHNVGPLPEGLYTIGPAKNPIDELGPIALELIPDPSNEMFGRFGFFIHGDNQLMNYTASNGCIILPRAVRQYIEESPDKLLSVI
jgi:hypothetical protein